MLTLEEMKKLPKEGQQKIVKKVGAARKKGKATNYSATYGAGGATIARAADVPVHEGEQLHGAYWKLNWSIPAVADSLTGKTCKKQKCFRNHKKHYKIFRSKSIHTKKLRVLHGSWSSWIHIAQNLNSESNHRH